MVLTPTSVCTNVNNSLQRTGIVLHHSGHEQYGITSSAALALKKYMFNCGVSWWHSHGL